MRVILLAAAAVLAAYAPATAQVTRGDLADMAAADGVQRCARHFLGKPNEGPDHEVWIMCVQSSITESRRDPVQVANQIIRREESNVFVANGQPMSSELEERIRSGI